jgi:type IV secretion system protein VirB10
MSGHSVAGERGTPIVAKRAKRLTRLATGASVAVAVGVVLAFTLGWYYTKSARAEPPRAKPPAVSGEFRLPPLVWPAALGGESPPVDQQAEALEEAPSSDEEYALQPVRTLEPPPLHRARHVRTIAPDARDQVPVDRTVSRRDEAEVSPVWYRPVAAARIGGPAATRTQAERVAAIRMPAPAFWVPRGYALDCTLKTAIDSTLAGLATCVTATDLYGADGSTVLLERGTELTGRVAADVRTGQARVGVTWDEARTPGGVLVALDSPGTDALGRAGLTGHVDRHFDERFGAAILLTLIDAGLEMAIESQREAGSQVIVSPSGVGDLATEVLRETIAIPPTIRVPQGTRVQVLAARHLDFEPVYALVHETE